MEKKVISLRDSFKVLEGLGAAVALVGIVSSIYRADSDGFVAGYIMIAGVAIFAVGIIGQKRSKQT